MGLKSAVYNQERVMMARVRYVLILSVARKYVCDTEVGDKRKESIKLMQYLLKYYRFHSGLEFQVCNCNQRITLTTNQNLTLIFFIYQNSAMKSLTDFNISTDHL